MRQAEMELGTAACTVQQINLQAAVSTVFLPNVSPSCLLVTCFLKSEAIGHSVNGRNPKNSVN